MAGDHNITRCLPPRVRYGRTQRPRTAGPGPPGGERRSFRVRCAVALVVVTRPRARPFLDVAKNATALAHVEPIDEIHGPVRRKHDTALVARRRLEAPRLAQTVHCLLQAVDLVDAVLELPLCQRVFAVLLDAPHPFEKGFLARFAHSLVLSLSLSLLSTLWDHIAPLGGDLRKKVRERWKRTRSRARSLGQPRKG